MPVLLWGVLVLCVLPAVTTVLIYWRPGLEGLTLRLENVSTDASVVVTAVAFVAGFAAVAAASAGIAVLDLLVAAAQILTTAAGEEAAAAERAAVFLAAASAPSVCAELCSADATIILSELPCSCERAHFLASPSALGSGSASRWSQQS